MLNWGIISSGKISSDFVTALSVFSDRHKVVCVAARSLSSAEEFVKSHGLEGAKAYGSYEELVKDSNVGAVYIGAINPQHIHLIKLAINNRRPCLCEKPLAVNLRETRECVELAKTNKVFLMEGIWSRTFPVYTRLRQLLDSDIIGPVLQIIVNFGTLLLHKDRCRLKELGGGAMLDIGVYCIQLVSFVFKGERPTKIVSGGFLNSDGIDDSSSSTLLYSNGKTATVIVHGGVKMDSVATIVGTKGTLKVPMRFWCPTELVLPDKTIETFDLPVTDKKFNYANSVGLAYEADEVKRCLDNGLLESPTITLDETIVVAEIMEQIRKQVGVTYPQDNEAST